jgi:hypothetical protein
MSQLPEPYLNFQKRFLMIPTLGFPATMAALTWAEDILEDR